MAKSPTNKIEALQDLFFEARESFNAALIERTQEIDIALTALLCKEHSLFIGPVGTAKSLLMDALAALLGVPAHEKFKILFTKFTTPEEVFGPIDPNKMIDKVNPMFFRHTAGKFPEAKVAIFEEVFKASSAILNTLLMGLNEGIYINGDGVHRKIPVLTCIGASNELPNDADGGQELTAFRDRFLFCKIVKTVRGQSNVDRLLGIPVEGLTFPNRDHTPQFQRTITTQEVFDARSAAADLPYTQEAKDAFMEILSTLAKAHNIHPGDRRKYKSVQAVQAYAFMNKATSVEIDHLEILSHILWEDPTSQQAVFDVVARIANPVGASITSLLIQTEEIIQGPKTAVEKETKLNEIEKKLKDIKKDPRKKAALDTFDKMQKAFFTKLMGPRAGTSIV